MSRHRTRAERRAFVEAFARAGMTKAAFAEAHGITVSSLERWRRAHRDGGLGTAGFLEVRQEQPAEDTWALRVGGLPEITFPSRPDALWLGTFVRALLC